MERGFSVAGLGSKSLDQVGGDFADFDIVITMGCMAEPPKLPVCKPRKLDSHRMDPYQDVPYVQEGVEYQDWGLPDPAKDPSVVGLVIDEVKRRVMSL